MTFLHLFIVNKSGSLIHHRPLSDKAPQIDINEWLRIGSTFHSLHAIAAEASPLRLPNNKNYCKLLTHLGIKYIFDFLKVFVTLNSVTNSFHSSENSFSSLALCSLLLLSLKMGPMTELSKS
jgi:hypothetical protein